MKKIIVLFVTCILTFSASFAGGNPELSKELKDKIVVDLSNVDLNEYAPEFVEVQFEIFDGEIIIREINSTNCELQEILLTKMYSLHIDADYVEGQVYSYKFSFKFV
ncbi:MAG: hypothetical protein ACI837_001462 [Crocinitomicaceae bacterium]|jgi:hypothetical protein